MTRFALFALYATTGAIGLTYEVIWSRYLALMVGNTAYAHAAVLAAFMGGLALGAWLFGGVADRTRNGLRLYGWLEVGIGLYAALFPTLFALWSDLLAPLAEAAGPGTGAMAAFKLAFAVLCVLPPTILMGGTLPILTRFLTASPAGLRTQVAALYAVNSLGAVVGGLIAGFFLISEWGLPASISGAGMLNMLLGLGAVVLSLRIKPVEATSAPSGDAASQDDATYDPRTRRIALWLAGFSGFATMALEIGWIRYFGLMLGSSTYAFTLMLAAFITGIGLGSLWLSRAKAGRLPLMPLLAVSLLVTAGFLALELQLYDRLPYALAHLRRAFAPDVDAYPYYQVAVYTACFLLMCLPTVVAGIVFPATVRLATEAGRMGGRLGRIYAMNTVGTVLGATLTGLVLFGLIGLEWVLRGVMLGYAIGAAVLAVLCLRGRLKTGIIAAAAVIAVGHFVAFTSPDPRLLNLGLYRRQTELSADFAQFKAANTADRLAYVGEGPHAAVTVRESGARPLRVMTVNGKPDASNGADMNPQALLGHLPVLLHPAPKRVFVLGLGSGVTAGAALTHGVQVDVAEISGEVVDAARLFAPSNEGVHDHPNATVFIEDARTVLRFSPTTYDVIISEPTNPWQAGIAGLFTVEFFDQVRARLTPGGLFVQWMHSYEIDDASMRMVVATLLARFRHVNVFEMGRNDYMFIAGDAPLTLDAANFEARFMQPAVRRNLARIGMTHPFAVLATQVKSAARLRAEVEGEVNSDEHPLLEFRAPAQFFAESESDLLDRLDENLQIGPPLLGDRWRAQRPLDAAAVAGLHDATAPFPTTRARRAALLRLARAYLNPRDPRIARLFRQTLVADPEDAAPEVDTLPTTAPALRAAFERELLRFEGRFHRWAPPPVEPLERLLTALEAAGQPAVVARYRGRLMQSVCRRGLTACERLIAASPDAPARTTAAAEFALTRGDLAAAAAALARLTPGPLHRRLARLRAARQITAGR